jgi:phosphatidylserine/phosphatidylglycerophosphate/cardiolipin synthase-like enzyme
MAELLTTKEILAALENIIKKAEKYICIFTFNIKIDQNYLARLRNASKRGIQITVVFGVDNGDDQVLNELLSMPNCTVYFKENLHAKFYYNEKELLVGSMNLSEASAKNNFELGVHFKSEEYTSVIKKVKEEAKEIISDAVLWKERGTQPFHEVVWEPSKMSPSKDKKTNSGACIRCNVQIKYNTQKPLCIDCYHEWAEWENEYYIETYCHACSRKKEDISFAKPECVQCYHQNMPFF